MIETTRGATLVAEIPMDDENLPGTAVGIVLNQEEEVISASPWAALRMPMRSLVVFKFRLTCVACSFSKKILTEVLIMIMLMMEEDEDELTAGGIDETNGVVQR